MNNKLLKALNDQLNREMRSAHIYFSMASDLDALNWRGMSAWLKGQASEEQQHAMKIYDYLYDQGERAYFTEIPAAKMSLDSPLEIFKAALDHEKYITSCIWDLVRLAREVDDIAAENFLQWFVSEQVEEVSTVNNIVDTLAKVGDSVIGLFQADSSLKR